MYFSFNSDLLPHISFMNKCTTPANWIHPRRTSSEYILFIVLSGEMYLQEDDSRYILKAGDYIFLQPGHMHCGYQASQCEYYYIHFQSECLTGWDCHENPQIMQIITENNRLAYQCDPFNEDLYHNYKLFVPKDRHIYSRSIMQQIHVHMNEITLMEKKQIPHYKLNCSSHFIEIMILFSRDFVSHILPSTQGKSYSANSQKMQALINYIHINYAESISSQEIEEQFHMNFDSLNRLFKQETGFTIFRYLRQVRLNHARELLTTTQLKLSEISEYTGFCDQYYFSRAFKQEFGVSPKKYAHDSMKNHKA